MEKEKRRNERSRCVAPICFAHFNREPCFDAQTLNCGAGGMCFKSHFFLKPGAILLIRLKRSNLNSLGHGVPEGLRTVTVAEVKWCKMVHDSNFQVYGVGVGYFQQVY